jgi:hypothetical protein
MQQIVVPMHLDNQETSSIDCTVIATSNSYFSRKGGCYPNQGFDHLLPEITPSFVKSPHPTVEKSKWGAF